MMMICHIVAHCWCPHGLLICFAGSKANRWRLHSLYRSTWGSARGTFTKVLHYLFCFIKNICSCYFLFFTFYGNQLGEWFSGLLFAGSQSSCLLGPCHRLLINTFWIFSFDFILSDLFTQYCLLICVAVASLSNVSSQLGCSEGCLWSYLQN